MVEGRRTPTRLELENVGSQVKAVTPLRISPGNRETIRRNKNKHADYETEAQTEADVGNPKQSKAKQQKKGHCVVHSRRSLLTPQLTFFLGFL